MSQPTSLAEFVRERRLSMGLTQSDFAEVAGIKRAHLSQIENGRITLPAADLRRKLAKALGVSHIDLMIAAGELTPEEAQGADPFAPPTDPNEAWAQEVWAMARAVDWDDSRLNTIMAIMSAWIDEDRTGWRRRRTWAVHAEPGGPPSLTWRGRAAITKADRPTAFETTVTRHPAHEDADDRPERYVDEHGIPRTNLGDKADPDATTNVDLAELFRMVHEAGIDPDALAKVAKAARVGAQDERDE